MRLCLLLATAAVLAAVASAGVLEDRAEGEEEDSLLDREKRQIQFGSSSNNDNNNGRNRNRNRNRCRNRRRNRNCNRGNGGGGGTPDVTNLEDLLGANAPEVEQEDGGEDILTRFNAPGVDTRRQGRSCLVPRRRGRPGGPGVCSFIFEPQCGDVVRQIRRNGVTQRIIRFLIQAIRPCGFDRTDYTLCCPVDDDGATTTTTRRPNRPTTTTRPTITTTRRTTTTTRRTTTTQAPLRGCGFTPFRTRIVNGREAEVGAWPWAAILGSRRSATSFTVVCGGSLITPNRVLTAAHCFPDGRNDRITHVRLGEHNIGRRDEDPRGGVVDALVSSVSAHRGFTTQELKNDIAVVSLDRSVALTDRINIVCLPPRSLRNVDLVSSRGTMTVIGWGATGVGGGTVQELRQANVPLRTTAECNAVYSAIDRNPRLSIDTADQLCAGRGVRDSCTGDSGGGLLTQVDGRYTVAGITSFGVECARPDFPGVYTRVDNFLNWINRRI